MIFMTTFKKKVISLIELNDIRAIAKPQDVAKYFLGEPNYIRGNRLWYCSPFRNEQHPSFSVTSKGMYDFGSNESYDIFKFVQRIKNCSFKESVNILSSLYGVSGRDYEDHKLVEWYRKQRQEQEEYHETLDWFYLRVWDLVDDEYHINKDCIEIFKHHPEMPAYKICLDEQPSIWGMEEHLAQDCDTWEKKEELMNKAMKGELPTWLMNRLKGTMILMTLNTKLKQKREY